MSGGRVSLVTVPPVRRVPPLLEESFIPGGRVIRSCRRMEKEKKKRKERNRDSVESAWKFMTWRVYSHWFTRGLILIFPFVSHAFREARRWFHTLSPPLFLFRSVSLLCRLSLDDGVEYCRRNFGACSHLLLSSAFGDTCNYELPIVVS